LTGILSLRVEFSIGRAITSRRERRLEGVAGAPLLRRSPEAFSAGMELGISIEPALWVVNSTGM
jgi:hypothetical protein